MDEIDRKKDPSPSIAEYEPELEKSRPSREVVDGPDSTEREFDEEAAAEDEKISFPEGGRGWFVVAGAVVSSTHHLRGTGLEKVEEMWREGAFFRAPRREMHELAAFSPSPLLPLDSRLSKSSFEDDRS